MSRKRRWFVVATIVILAALSAICIPVMIFAFSVMGCETNVKRLTPSIDGKRMIVMFEKECGATVGFKTQLSLSHSGRKFSSDENPPFLVVDGRHDLSVRWLGEKAIVVDLPIGERVLRNEQRVDDVVVEYK
jgi:hypothetical protein